MGTIEGVWGQIEFLVFPRPLCSHYFSVLVQSLFSLISLFLTSVGP